MAEYYEILYPHFDEYRFFDLMERFQLDRRRKLASFSKGMKRQVLMLLGICAGTKYLLCDETFDGLDPLMRQAMKGILAGNSPNAIFPWSLRPTAFVNWRISAITSVFCTRAASFCPGIWRI